MAREVTNQNQQLLIKISGTEGTIPEILTICRVFMDENEENNIPVSIIRQDESVC